MDKRTEKRIAKRKRKKKIKKIVAKVFVIVTLCFAGMIGAFMALTYHSWRQEVRESLVVEVGTPVNMEDFLVNNTAGLGGFRYSSKSDAFDFNRPGKYNIYLQKGSFHFLCKFEVLDTVAPSIEGVHDINVFLGDGISYKDGITVVDNYDTNPELRVDNSTVNVSSEGVYYVTYYASDEAGNTSMKTCAVTIESKLYPKEQVDAYAKEIVAQIITDDMSDEQKLNSIYSWIRDNISYINYSEKNGWRQAAYEGMVLRQGDCYVFASTAKELLTVCGIKNMDIQKIPGKTMHYWNLVDIGSGWYHYDTCPRADGASFCYVSDEELMSYSNSHDNSHEYKREEYPEIQ